MIEIGLAIYIQVKIFMNTHKLRYTPRPIEGAHQCAASHAGEARATTRDLVICPSAIHGPTPSLPHYATATRRASSCAMRAALPCHVNPLLSFGWEE